MCLLIDDQPLIRLGIRQLLDGDYEVEELSDGTEAIELLNKFGSFELAIVELRPAGDDGIPSGAETIRSLVGAQPALGIVAHGGPIDRHAVREALNAGAGAYASSRSLPETMREAITAIADHRRYVDPLADSAGGNTITRRQRQVLQLFADGLSTVQIAGRLGLSDETVRTHAKASLARLGARDRTHAIAIALRSSLIT